MIDFDIKDSHGNKIFCKNNIVTIVPSHKKNEWLHIGEFNNKDHFVMGRKEQLPDSYKLNNCYPVPTLIISKIELDKYVVLNTVNGCYAMKAREVRDNSEVYMSVGYGHVTVYLVPISIMQKASLKGI